MPKDAVLWFAEKSAEFLLFRVNRRPIGEDTLFPSEIPRDPLDHFWRVLAPGWQVITGKKHQRVWRMGGIELDVDAGVVTGKTGWEPRGEEVVSEWSDEAKDWLSSTATPHGGRVLPFALDGDTRILTVLRDPSSQANTIAHVFEQTLRDNEQELEDPTTEWSVEPILDPRDFGEWLDSVDVVNRVTFAARLPNPEPNDLFADLEERMRTRGATRFTEEFRSDKDSGLSGIEEDRDFKQAVEMGRQGFATLSGVGRRGGSEARYTQTERVARERVEDLPSSWDEVRKVLIRFLKDRAGRLLGDDDAT